MSKCKAPKIQYWLECKVCRRKSSNFRGLEFDGPKFPWWPVKILGEGLRNILHERINNHQTDAKVFARNSSSVRGVPWGA